MNILIFDTETIDLKKPFCYNIGYCIYNTEEKEIILKKEFVIEQIWHNAMLFSGAYFNNKKTIYVNRLRGRKITLEKWGYVMRKLYQDIKDFEITDVYAYNSDFDKKVIAFNCDWFKTLNPFDSVQIHDILGYVSKVISFDKNFQSFCEENKYFTEKDNYSPKAEIVYRFISGENNFIEEHTALSDSLIECQILLYCIENGCEFNTDYEVVKIVPRVTEKTLIIIDSDKLKYEFKYTSKRKIPNKEGYYLYNNKS